MIIGSRVNVGAPREGGMFGAFGMMSRIDCRRSIRLFYRFFLTVFARNIKSHITLSFLVISDLFHVL